MNLAAVEDMEARFPDSDIVLIESGGDNLTLTFSPALVDYFIYVIDVAAGDKIPRKNGPGITQSDILVINKTDLAPHVGASLEVMGKNSRLMRGDKPFLFTNCKTGEGIPQLGRPDRDGIAVRSSTLHTPAGAHDDAPLARSVGGAPKRSAARRRSSRHFRTSRRRCEAAPSARPASCVLASSAAGDARSWPISTSRSPTGAARALLRQAMPDLAWVFLITTTGCLLQGDRMALDIALGAGARAHVTTQSATKIHSDGRQLRGADADYLRSRTMHISSFCPIR